MKMTKLKELKQANFLRKGISLQASDFEHASLRQLVTPAGLTWLKASTAQLDRVKRELAARPEGRALDAERIRDIFELYGDGADLQRDGRPRQELIWKNYYAASLVRRRRLLSYPLSATLLSLCHFSSLSVCVCVYTHLLLRLSYQGV